MKLILVLLLLVAATHAGRNGRVKGNDSKSGKGDCNDGNDGNDNNDANPNDKSDSSTEGKGSGTEGGSGRDGSAASSGQSSGCRDSEPDCEPQAFFPKAPLRMRGSVALDPAVVAANAKANATGPLPLPLLPPNAKAPKKNSKRPRSSAGGGSAARSSTDPPPDDEALAAPMNPQLEADLVGGDEALAAFIGNITPSPEAEAPDTANMMIAGVEEDIDDVSDYDYDVEHGMAPATHPLFRINPVAPPWHNNTAANQDYSFFPK
jgi:hypothetical protein